MISYQEAYNIVKNHSIIANIETTSIENSLGRILAQNVYSDINMPPFDKSAMDGYACRSEDLYNELEIIEIIPAGKSPEKKIIQNTCAKIMTGAPIPDGADTVFMIEHSRQTASGKVIFSPTDDDTCSIPAQKYSGSNICKLGEDIKTGEIVLSKGTLIKPQHIAILASVGCVFPEVFSRIKVGIVATGSELVEPNEVPENSQIRNSNGIQMIAQLVSIGAIPIYYGIAKDTLESTFERIKKATEENDIVMISGGVSEGDFDFVPEIIKQLGFNILFDKVAVQPGKPTTFAVKGNKVIFGMPGNPVSSFVQFELLVKPFIYNQMGITKSEKSLQLIIGEDYKRKKANRLSWIPVYIEKAEVFPVKYNGSAHIGGYSVADAIMEIPLGIPTLKKGEKVNVRQI